MLVNAVMLVLSMSLALFIGESLVRTFAPQQLSVPFGATVDGIISQRPNIHGRYAVPGVFDTTVTINSQRLRAEKEYPLQPPSGVIRIVMLGDSFTFGIGANDEETYPANLEQLLAVSSDTPRFEVINAGVGGTGTGEQARHFDSWVKQFRPRIVVLTAISNDVDDDLDRGLFVLNAEGEVRPRPLEELAAEDRHARTGRNVTSALPGYAFLSQHSHLLNLVRDAVNEAIVDHRRVSASGAMSLPEGDLVNRYRSYGLPLMAGEVRWLQQSVQALGARLVVVFVPQREAVYSSTAPWTEDVRWKTNAIAEGLRQVCLENRIPFLNLTPQLRKAAEQTRPLYYEGGDTHPAPAGYRLIAEEVARFLLIVNSDV